MKRFAAALFLLAAVVVLYRKTIRLWWTYDDPWLLHRAIERPWFHAFIPADTWHRVSAPLLDSTYEAMVSLAGLEAHRWYRFQLVLLALCAFTVYAALRLYLKTVPSVAGAFLFLAGAPACTFVTHLMLVHYLEAITFAALALIAFVQASRRQSNALMLLSALSYLLAMFADGAAVLLPLVLLALPERTLRVRARHLVFHFVMVGAYFAWRMANEEAIGSTAWTIGWRDIPGLIATLPCKLVHKWAGASIGVGLVAIAFLAIGMGVAFWKRNATALALTGLFVAIAPIVLVSKEMQPTWAFIPWLWACAAFVCGAAALRSSAQNVLLVAAAIAVVIANRQEWTEQFAKSERMSDEARAFVALNSADVLRLPAVPPGAMNELRWLKEEYFRRARGTGWYYDDLFLCGGAPLEQKRFFEYIPERREVVEVTARIPDFARAYCSSIREKAPLHAEFRHRRDALFWRFGPYRDGKWRVVLGGGLQAFDVPREDGFRLPGVAGLALRVRYQSPEGWVTYSPEINLEFARQPEVVWHR